MKFIVIYLLSAAALAVIVWFGVPQVRTLAMSTDPTPQAPQTPEPAPRSTSASSVPVAKPVAAPVSAPVAGVPQTSATTGATPVAAPAATPAPRPAPVPQPAPQTVVIYEEAPAEPVQQPGYTGPRYDWGVLAEETMAYDEADGKPRMKLAAGTVVEKMESRQSSGGEVFVCRALLNRRWEKGFAIKSSAVVLFEGPFADAPKARSDKVIRYFQLQGFVAARTQSLREEHLRRNPHFEEYRKAATAYREFQDNVKRLTAERDAAQGAQRAKLASELDRMRPQGTQLENALRKAEGPYKRWKDEHGDGIEAVINDERIAEWNEEIEDLRDEVAEMVPGL